MLTLGEGGLVSISFAIGFFEVLFGNSTIQTKDANGCGRSGNKSGLFSVRVNVGQNLKTIEIE